MGNEPASDMAYSLDVNPEEIDPTANKGLMASRVGDESGEDDLNI
jgi:hypothetical protein